MKHNITLLVLTHKDSGTIFKSIDSFKNMVSNNLHTIIGYDNHNDDIYKKKLEDFCKKNDCELVVTDNANLSYNVINSIKHIKTKYIFVLEHDWIFNKKIYLNKILRLFENNEDINYIRFNKRKSTIQEKGTFDKTLEKTNIDGIDLLKVWSYSGNPHIVRTEFLKNMVIPLTKSSEWLEHKHRGIEKPITLFIKRKQLRFGNDKSHKMFGTYIYGKFNEEPYVTHIG